MQPASVITALTAVRIGIGAGLLVAPGFAGRVWVGDHADGPGARVFARAIGARDLLLAGRALAAQAEGGPEPRWLRYEAAADAGTAVATLLAARNLTPGRRVAMPLIAGGYAALGWWVASQLERA